MSIAQILEEAKTLPTSDLESLEHSLRLERLQRAGKLATAEETQLLAIINTPLAQSARYWQLRDALAQETLTEQDHAELVQISDQREKEWAKKLEAILRLATLRGEEFQVLYKKLGIQNTTGFKE